MEKTTLINRNPMHGATLLPYLQPVSKAVFHLRFPPPESPEEAGARGAPCPAGGCAVTSLFFAELSVGAERPVLPLALLLQADDYQASAADLSGLANPDIENHWRQALTAAVQACTEGFPVVLPPQVSENGGWIPFGPLFYCTHKALYSHVFCPYCGQPLSLCQDDDLLDQAGLPNYSTTLNRFLYCPKCRQEHPVYYTRTDTSIDLDNGQIHGPSRLIENYSRLLARRDLAAELPCIDCPEAGACFGPANQCLQRMTVFRFFPFHMIMRQSADICATDFIHLLSGARLDQLQSMAKQRGETVRQARLERIRPMMESGSGLLFGDASRRFPELLYLKLTFLSELVAKQTQWFERVSNVAGALSMSGLWVELGRHAARLPWLWRFSLHLIDTVGAPIMPLGSNTVINEQLRQFIGKVWFYTLLVNDRQPFSVVAQAIEKILARHAEDARSPGAPFCEEGMDVFEARNLFWYRDSDAVIETSWRNYWRQALDMGFSFFGADDTRDRAGLFTGVATQLEGLREAIRKDLFYTRPEPVQNSLSEQERDSRIADILADLLNQWPDSERERAGASFDPHAGQSARIQADVDGDVEETIILSDQSGFTAARNGGDKPMVESDEKRRRPSFQNPSKQPLRGDELEKTVVIGATPPFGQAARQATDLEETVVMTPQTQIKGHTAQPVRPDASPAPEQDEPLTRTVIVPARRLPENADELEKTMIMGFPGNASANSEHLDDGGRPKRDLKNHDDHRDDLDATVIITPGKPKK